MEFEKVFLKIAETLEKQGKPVEPCSWWEIRKIKKMAGGKLPEVYLLFLETMGKRGGDFMKGSDAFYGQLDKLKEDAVEILREQNFTELPEKSFVFWMHQGYQFAFFKLDEGDDPPVYFYLEGQKENDFTTKESLSGFYLKQLEFLQFHNKK